jgi:ribosomal protein S12 methylthiotransferase accessory factor
MKLQLSPKVNGHGLHRTVTPEETLRNIRPMARAAGVTRLADITGLDRIGIPAFAAVVPQSRDILSIYNGKGVSEVDAACGALMEAIERQSAIKLTPGSIVGSYTELAKHCKVLDPRSMNMKLHSEYSDELRQYWIEAFDISRSESILVPHSAAGFFCSCDTDRRCFAVNTSNGIASGNTREEAVCHALCEVIERDAWTLAEVRAKWIPHVLGTRSGSLHERHDDLAAHPNIDLTVFGDSVSDLAHKYMRAGVNVVVKDVTSDLGIPTIMCTCSEDYSSTMPMVHGGWGTHPDVLVAMVRALTEAAQSRVGDIQGVREDMAYSHESVDPWNLHTKRVATLNSNTWRLARSPWTIGPERIKSYTTSNVLDDINIMLLRLRTSGLDRVIVVDLTDDMLKIPVVRVIVPGLESWSVDRGKLGARALNVIQKGIN